MDCQVKLRALEPTDIDIIYRLENTPEVWRVSFGDAFVSRHMLWEYINNYSADPYADHQLRLMVQYGAMTVGTLDITDFDPRNSRAFVGVAIDKDFRKNGIATEALKQLIELCRAELGIHQLVALVPKDNDASLHLFTNLNFKTSGCLRSWLKRDNSYTDVVIFQLML